MEGTSDRHQQTIYKPLWKNPLGKNRGTTDHWFILLWGFILSTWLFGVLYVLVTTPWIQPDTLFTKEIKYENQNPIDSGFIKAIDDTRAALVQYFHANPIMVITGLLTASAFVLGFLSIGRYKPVICCFFGVGSLPILMICFLIYMYYKITTEDVLDVFDWCVTIISRSYNVIFMILALFCVYKAGIVHMIAVGEKTSRIFTTQPSLIFFSVIIYVFAIIVALAGLLALNNLKFKGFVSYVLIIESMYLVYFILCFGTTVISQIVAAWHWTEDKKDLPKTLVFQCIVNVNRYHFGSIAFGATYIGPIIAGIIAAYNTKRPESKSRFDQFLEAMLTTCLIFDMATYSLITNVVYGQDFYRSTKRVFRLFRRNCVTSLSFIWVFYGIKVGVFVIMLILAALPLMLWTGQIHSVEQSFATFELAVISLPLLILPVQLVVDSIGQTNYLCTLEVDEEKDDVEERPTAVSLNVTA